MDELLRRAIDGDFGALGKLLDIHAQNLRSFAASRISSKYRGRIESDDVMQVTFSRVISGIQRFEPRGASAFENWLNTVAERVILDAIRAINCRPHDIDRHNVKSDEAYYQLLASIDAESTSPSAEVAARELKEMLDSAIRKLPREFGIVIRVCEIEGKTLAEAAEQLGCSVGKAWGLREVGRELLRNCLGSSSNFFTNP